MVIRGFYTFLLFLPIFLVFQPDSKGQESSSNKIVDSLVQIALENNPEILSNKYSQQSAEFKAKSAGTIPDPKFTIAALNMSRSSLSLDETPMSGIALGLSQTVPWPGRLKAKKAMARLQSDSQKQNIQQKENSIVQMVKHFYYDYSYWTKAGQILDSNIELVEFLINAAETKYANGIGTAQDALRAHTTKARLENKKLFMAQMSRTALLNLGQLIDDTSIVHANLSANLPEKLNYELLNLELNNPHLKKAEIQTSISKKRLALAKSGYYPNFTFGFDYRIRRDIPMDAVRGEDFVTVKAGLQLPLWFFAKQNNETKAARHTIKASEENYHSIQNQIKKQIAVVRIALKTITESFEQYNNSISPQARAAYEAARVAYEVGEVDFNALLAAQLDLFEIELERIELLKNYWQKKAEFSELCGEK